MSAKRSLMTQDANATRTLPDPTAAAQPKPQPVHFEYVDPSARKVCLAGSFNNWQPESAQMTPAGGGRWVKDLALLPGSHEYRLVVDGRWMTDPRATRTRPNPFGEQNSVVDVVFRQTPAPPPTAAPEPGPTAAAAPAPARNKRGPRSPQRP
jgi:1,4-alpha-glucan branching enzyme